MMIDQIVKRIISQITGNTKGKRIHFSGNIFTAIFELYENTIQVSAHQITHQITLRTIGSHRVKMCDFIP